MLTQILLIIKKKLFQDKSKWRKGKATLIPTKWEAKNNFNEKGLSLIIKKNKNKGSNQTYLSISNPHYATHACTKSSIHTHQPHI